MLGHRGDYGCTGNQRFGATPAGICATPALAGATRAMICATPRRHCRSDGISKSKTADAISPIGAGGVLCRFFYLRVVTESERLLLRLLLLAGEVFLGFADQIEAARDTDQLFLGYFS